MSSLWSYLSAKLFVPFSNRLRMRPMKCWSSGSKPNINRVPTNTPTDTTMANNKLRLGETIRSTPDQ